jgi:hypothetical protein
VEWVNACRLTRTRRAAPPRAGAAALVEHHAVASGAATTLRLVLVGVACRRKVRGDEPRAKRSRHGRHCPSPALVPPRRSGSAGSRARDGTAQLPPIRRRESTGARAPRRRCPRTAEGQEPGGSTRCGRKTAMGRARRNESKDEASGGGASISREKTAA